MSHQERIAFIWSIAESLRGSYKPHEYGQVILPLVVLRRLDAVMVPKRGQMAVAIKEAKDKGLKDPLPVVRKKTGLDFYNTSNFTFSNLTDDASQLAQNLKNYINGFSPNAREILEKFEYHKQIDKLRSKKRLFQVLDKFRTIDLSPDRVSNHDMGYVYEELLRRFSELSNETAGEYFTPRDVVRLMVDLLLAPDETVLAGKRPVAAIYDPACGTGGMLTVAREHILELNAKAEVMLFGQELNDETYAIANSDLLIHALDTSRIHPGNSLTEDAFEDEKFDYMMANPPFGVDWSDYQEPIRREHEQGTAPNRFHAGLPRKGDGALLFLQQMVSKMRAPTHGGSRIGIVFSGSPLFTGDAGSGESEIRRWLLEEDLVEAIIGLPDQLFYNTGISTYIWILSNRKPPERRGKVQLVDGREHYIRARKSYGAKRKELSEEDRDNIVQMYDAFDESGNSKILSTKEFGYRLVTVEQPLQLDLSASPQRLDRVKTTTVYQNLTKPKKNLSKNQQEVQVREGEVLQRRVIDELATIGNETTTDYDAFYLQVKEALERAGGKWTTANVHTIVRALGERNEDAPLVVNKKGRLEPDPSMRDRERVPLSETVDEYMRREVYPWIPDAWVDESKRDRKDGKIGAVGYEIGFNKYFYQPNQPRSLEEIDEEFEELEGRISDLLSAGGRLSAVEPLGPQAPLYAAATVRGRIGWKGLKADEYIEDGPYFLSTPCMRNGRINWELAKHIPHARYEESPEIALRSGDVLLTKDGFTYGTVGYVDYLPGPATVNSSLAVLRCKQTYHPRFLYWVLNSKQLQDQMAIVVDGMDVRHLF